MNTQQWSPFTLARFGLLFLCISIGIAFYFGYNYYPIDPPGYCRQKNTYMSDDFFIRTAIQLREKDWIRRGGKEIFRYSGRDFDPKNPNCCRVIRDETFFLFNRLFDRQEISVELNNETSSVDIYSANLNDRFFFDPCGNLKGRIEYNWQAQ